MSDTREALARLLMDWGCDDESAGRCAGEILAEFLVVPRSDIVGTEYGWQCTTVEGLPKARQRVPGGREAAIRDVRRVRRNQEAEGLAPDVELLSRPVLPWSVTPLPENGEKP